MIQFFYHMFLYNLTQLFCIKYKTGIRIRFAFNGYIQFKIMAMPVFIGTFTKHQFILLISPGRIV